MQPPGTSYKTPSLNQASPLKQMQSSSPITPVFDTAVCAPCSLNPCVPLPYLPFTTRKSSTLRFQNSLHDLRLHLAPPLDLPPTPNTKPLPDGPTVFPTHRRFSPERHPGDTATSNAPPRSRERLTVSATTCIASWFMRTKLRSGRFVRTDVAVGVAGNEGRFGGWWLVVGGGDGDEGLVAVRAGRWGWVGMGVLLARI